MNDLIERNAALDALDEKIEQCNKALEYFDISSKDEYALNFEKVSLSYYREKLEKIPFAHSEVVKCKDCKYWRIWERESLGSTNATTSWLPCRQVMTNENWFCGYAERREDERSD